MRGKNPQGLLQGCLTILLTLRISIQYPSRQMGAEGIRHHLTPELVWRGMIKQRIKLDETLFSKMESELRVSLGSHTIPSEYFLSVAETALEFALLEFEGLRGQWPLQTLPNLLPSRFDRSNLE